MAKKSSKPSSRAKVIPSYEAVKHTGIAAGDDIAPAKLNSYDQLSKSGVSMASQPDVATQVDNMVYGGGEGTQIGPYSSQQNAGGDTAKHGTAT